MASFDVVDTGLWEYRTQPRHYTFSKAMCWVAAHRGAELADVPRHARARARNGARGRMQKRAIILDRAYNKELGFFTQAFDGEYPDASNLLLPAIGLIDPLDPRFRSTVRAYERMLAPDGLMLRYKHLDDFGHTTSAFSICSFWWVEALAMMGEVDEAVALFQPPREVRQPAGIVLRGHRARNRRAARQFPAGLHARRLDPRRDHDRRDPRRATRIVPRVVVIRSPTLRPRTPSTE